MEIAGQLQRAPEQQFQQGRGRCQRHLQQRQAQPGHSGLASARGHPVIRIYAREDSFRARGAQLPQPRTASGGHTLPLLRQRLGAIRRALFLHPVHLVPCAERSHVGAGGHSWRPGPQRRPDGGVHRCQGTAGKRSLAGRGRTPAQQQ